MTQPTGQCWYLMEPGRMEMQDVPMPEPGPRDVIVEVRTALTCGTDLKAFRRGHNKIPMPGPFGHEYAGVVAAVGDEVQGWKPGDRICGVHTGPCNQCDRCNRGQENLCRHLFDHVHFGTYGRYYPLHPVVHTQNCFHTPAGIADERIAFMEPLACVIHGLDKVRIEEGDRVLVIGSGVIGLLHLLLARHQGAAEVAVLGRRELRLNLARELGASAVAEAPQGVAGDDALAALGADEGFDVVIECAGRVESWQSALALVRPGGRVSCFSGLPGGTEVPLDATKLHYSEITLTSPFHFTPRDVKQAFELLTQTDLPVERLLTDRLPLGQLNRAFDALQSGEGLKYALHPSAEGAGS